MATNKIHDLVKRSWPEFEKQPASIQTQLSYTLAVIIFLFPLFLIATSWLLFATDWQLLQTNGFLLLLLTIFVIIIDLNPYNIFIRVNRSLRIPLQGTLSSIIVYGALFLFGPTVFWMSWLSGMFTAIKQGWENNRQGLLLPKWFPLNSIVQMSGVTVLQMLITAFAYEQIGGVYPFSTTDIEQLQPVLIALLISIILPVVIFLPLLLIINNVSGGGVETINLIGMVSAIMGMGLIVEPFAIPFALSYSMMGIGMFLFLGVGIFLTQMLAVNLSRANIRNQARSNELEILETLGKAIIESPVDGSSLANLLESQLATLFPRGHIIIHLFTPHNEEKPQERPYFTIRNPQDLQIDASYWEQLQQSEKDYLIFTKQPVPNSKHYFGDLFLAKIFIPQDDGSQECVGGIYIHQTRSIRSTEERLPTILELAGQISAALYRAKVHAETLAYHKVTQELAFAGRIQASFLPKQIPQIDGWDIAATIIPAKQTSGDFYDFVDLENGRMGFVVADVADKGTGAALYMALSRTLIRTYAMQYPDDPGMALQKANERILSDTESDQFVTVFYGILDQASGKLTYANAGHNPPLVVGSQVASLTKTGIPLGMFEEMVWQSESIQLHTDDTIAMFTDGIPEAQNEQDVEFGDDRLLSTLQANQSSCAHEIVDVLVTAVQAFTANAPQFDDITLVILQKN